MSFTVLVMLRFHAVQKVSQLGGKVLACSDTHGWVEDQGIDYKVLENVYNKKRSGHDKGVTLAMYLDERPNAIWHAEDGRGVWQLPCDIALPCARENTLLLEDAQALVANGCKVVGEGQYAVHHRGDQLLPREWRCIHAW